MFKREFYGLVLSLSFGVSFGVSLGLLQMTGCSTQVMTDPEAAVSPSPSPSAEASASPSPSASPTPSLSFVVADPYISGAQCCVDANSNEECDDGELLSTVSNSSGAFSFDPQPAGGFHHFDEIKQTGNA
ncbi:hypothetical protein WDW37_21110 [Bdellovibrionota bacterium FG-1]